jgi:isovaleryl-CoA dehydrogenase
MMHRRNEEIRERKVGLWIGRAIQVMGGYGYVGEYVVERLWRDAKLLEIGGGTNESHHKNMSRDLRKMGSNRLD